MTNKQVATAILKHYWMREIGMETVALWKHKLTTRLEEILPKYVKMYAEIEASGSILENVSIKEVGNDKRVGSVTESGTKNTDVTDTKNQDSTVTGNNTLNRDVTTHGANQYSDTPQDGLTDVMTGKYLTSANVDDGSDITDETQTASTISKGMQNLTRDMDETSSNNRNSTETSDNTVTRNGYQGNKVEDVWQYSQKAVSVYQMIIRDVADCFMGILG